MSILQNTEDIKWANAAELGHMEQQIRLSKEDRKKLSEFLLLANEKTYNENIQKLKTHFLSVPESSLFMDRLNPIHETCEEPVWQRWFPLEKTPTTHILHASYLRIPLSTVFSFTNDPHQGLPIPDIFYRRENILGANIKYVIGNIDMFYYILKPFGYTFPDVIRDGTLQFRLFDITNPHYINLSRPNSKYRGAPTPIIKDGKIQPMMTNKEYTKAYKHYCKTITLPYF
jgi:hypothetical protein